MNADFISSSMGVGVPLPAKGAAPSALMRLFLCSYEGGEKGRRIMAQPGGGRDEMSWKRRTVGTGGQRHDARIPDTTCASPCVERPPLRAPSSHSHVRQPVSR